MGACFAPNYANQFIGLWEKDFIHYNYYSEMIKWWGGILTTLLWPGSDEELFLFSDFFEH